MQTFALQPHSNEVTFNLQDLLQELLLALIGCTGDVFVNIAPSSRQDLNDEILHPGRCTVQLAQDIAWAGKEDRDQLNELVKLGFHYQQIQRFIKQEEQAVSPRSLYRSALCEGLQGQLGQSSSEELGTQQQLISVKDCLQIYEEQLLEQGAARGLPGLVYQLADLQGAKLLAVLHARRLNGQPLLQTCVQRLLWHVNQVLFNQLTMWMVHGLLADEGNEFFIRPREVLTSGHQQQADDTAPAADSGMANNKHLLHRSEEETYRDWHEAFEVALHELPPGITPHLATSVEFIGRAQQPVLNQAALERTVEAVRTDVSHICCTSTAGNGAQQVEVGAWCVAPEQPVQAAVVLGTLGQQRKTPESRTDVASRLWQLLVVQAGLLQHLAAIKDYALLARGDFYQCFLADAAKLLAGPPRDKTVNSDLSIPWQSAALKSTAQDDPHFKLFRPVLRAKGSSTAGALRSQQLAEAGPVIGLVGSRALNVPAYDSAWDDLRLDIQMPWPLGVLLTRRHLERYNALFQFLLRLKRVQLALESAWQELGRLCGRGGGGTTAADIGPLLQLRLHMGHFISNLQIYLQLDVVEVNYARLQEKVAAAQDFSEAEHAHERFLHALVTQSFLGHSAIVKQIGEVFGQTRALCRLVKGARERGIDCDAVEVSCTCALQD
eukprot:gene5317-5550_t